MQEDKKAYLEEVLKQQETVDLEFSCHDCGKPVRVQASRDSEGIALQPQDEARGYYPTLSTGQKEYFTKCRDCFAWDPELRFFNPAEVYTRVVGYYRPVGAFNQGKKQEYSERKLYETGI